MKYIIRTVENGLRVPLERIEEKKKAAREKFLGAGFQYLEISGILGSLNALGERIEEMVFVIEGIERENYV